jgi:hypothetical protein
MEHYEPQTIVMLFKEITEKLDKLFKSGEDNAKRISTLERWRSYIMGGMAVIIFFLSVIALPLITNYLNNHVASASAQTTHTK